VERVASSQTRQPAGHQLCMRVCWCLQPRVASRGSEALWCASTPANALLPRHSLRPAAELLSRVLHSAKALVCAVHSVTASRRQQYVTAVGAAVSDGVCYCPNCFGRSCRLPCCPGPCRASIASWRETKWIECSSLPHMLS
jgi:hypothetical protein